MAILITRPAPDHAATATALRTKGFDVLLAPMLRFEPIAFEPEIDARFDAVLVTSVNALRAPDRAFLVITHYQRLLEHIVPDSVHVLYKGQVIKSGDKSLALDLEANGYAGVIGEAA